MQRGPARAKTTKAEKTFDQARAVTLMRVKMSLAPPMAGSDGNASWTAADSLRLRLGLPLFARIKILMKPMHIGFGTGPLALVLSAGVDPGQIPVQKTLQ